MRLKIGINGFGRIGSSFARIALQKDLFDIVLINTRSSTPEKILSLLQDDYVYGKFDKNITFKDQSLVIENKEIAINKTENLEEIPWDKYGVDVVIDATGVFLTEQELEKHLKNSVKKVILTTVSKDDKMPHIVLGVNDDKFDFKSSKIISNCSCTTNCAAIMYKVLFETYGIKTSFFTTVHAYTQSQISLENMSKLKATDLSIIPSTTGASKGIVRVIPELSNKIQGLSLRVPTPTVSFTDITAVLERPTTKEELNKLFKDKSEDELKGILGYKDSFLQSSDLIGSTFSCVLDSNYTDVIDGNFVKLTGWYDNEWGYSSRLVDLVERLSKLF